MVLSPETARSAGAVGAAGEVRAATMGLQALEPTRLQALRR